MLKNVRFESYFWSKKTPVNFNTMTQFRGNIISDLRKNELFKKLLLNHQGAEQQ